jgi:muconolactone delta-isomerase
MKVLAFGRDLVAEDNPRFADLRAAEARAVWELTQGDILREVYFEADRPNAVLVFEVPDVAAARAALDGLPLVAAGLIDFDVIPLRPYPGFAHLFREA